MLKTEDEKNLEKEEVKLAVKELEEKLIPKGVVCKTWGKRGIM
jgi:hypothetical protein